MLSAIDEQRITEAVSDSEARTTGEILVVLAEEVSRYREVPLAWAAALSLSLPPIALSLSLTPLVNLARNDWLIGQSESLVRALGLSVAAYAVMQIALFLIILAVIHIPAVRRRLTPRALKRHRVAKAAHHQFVSMGATSRESETGVLIFVALADRQTQILADVAIHQKCGETPWARAADAIVTAMKAGADPTAGIVEAVNICGEALAEHFPASGPRPQDFSPRPLEV